MKTLFTLVLLAVGFSAVAQRSSSKEVTTDDKQLRIRVDIEQPGHSIYYSRSFNIANMDKETIDALKTHILDSLDHAASDQMTEVADRKRDVSRRKRSDESQVTSVSKSEEKTNDAHLEASTTQSLSPSDVAPSSVLVREDKENNRLWMQYIFQKDGEELVLERTVNVVGKTEREKQTIIKETERSFGIKTGNQ